MLPDTERERRNTLASSFLTSFNLLPEPTLKKPKNNQGSSGNLFCKGQHSATQGRAGKSRDVAKNKWKISDPDFITEKLVKTFLIIEMDI